MVRRAFLYDSLRRFVQLLGSCYDIDEILSELLDRSVEVTGCAGAGVVIRHDDLRFLTATEQGVAALEECQLAAGEGPGPQARGSGRPVVCDDLRADGRWPPFRAAAGERGVVAVAGIPLVARCGTLGALDLYWGEPHQPTDEELDTVGLLVEMAAGSIVQRSLLDDTERLSRQLEAALRSRVVIEQAKGMLVEQHSTDPDSAFQLLRGHARSSRRRIHEVATELVEGRLQL